MTLPVHKWTLVRIAIFGILCVALLAAALAQSHQPSVKPSSQGTVQNAGSPQGSQTPEARLNGCPTSARFWQMWE